MSSNSSQLGCPRFIRILGCSPFIEYACFTLVLGILCTLTIWIVGHNTRTVVTTFLYFLAVFLILGLIHTLFLKSIHSHPVFLTGTIQQIDYSASTALFWLGYFAYEYKYKEKVYKGHKFTQRGWLWFRVGEPVNIVINPSCPYFSDLLDVYKAKSSWFGVGVR